MEENLRRLFSEQMTEEKAGNYSPLVLAFLGDAVFELYIRSILVREGNARPKNLNRRKAELVKASAQSALVARLEPLLTEREEEIYRRGRNAKAQSTAKHASVTDYRRATGFEALIGYLFLTGQTERILELMEKGISNESD